VRGLEFYQRKEVKDVLAYLHLLNNPANDVAFLRIINTPPRRIGRMTVKRVIEHARLKGISLLDAAREAGLIESLSKRVAVNVAKFVAMYDQMQLIGGEKVEAVVGNVLHHTSYRDWLASGRTEEERQRLDNIDELLTDAREFDEAHGDSGGLEAFLEQASLVADIDDWQMEADRVTLMTLHAAKGLEFPVVFIVAVEEDLLPHERNAKQPDKLEEERRLLFVGITRAQEELHLSASRARAFRGSTRPRAPSCFLLELPCEEMDIFGDLRCGVGFDADALLDDSWDQAEVVDEQAAYDREAGYTDDPPGRLTRANKQSRRESRTRNSTRDAADAPLVTAADMLGQQRRPPACSPESFRHGMVVTHPEYGLGKVVALGGSGAKRTAAVQFAGEEGTISFRLAFSPLRPAKE
jgi:DNA helicase-2/ATP-dependent DNA helicase PcrA